jgi:hypothetical protein
MNTSTSPRLSPVTKQIIKVNLEHVMYANTKRREQTKLQEISTKNMVLCRYSHNSFSYKGEYYCFESNPLRYKNQRLMADLQPVMDKWLDDKQNIEYNEMPFVNGFFNKVLNASNSVEDYRLLLPDCVHRAINLVPWGEGEIFPRELSDEKIAEFKAAHANWIMLLKKRMILDLVTT